MMEQKDFVQLVAKMRDAQKSYFKMRTSQDLSRSKQLERQVDAELSQYTIANGKAVKQQSLFDEQPAQQQAEKHPVLAIRCKTCGAVYFMHALAYFIDSDTAKEIADAVANGDTVFVADVSEVTLSQCKCNG